MPELPNPVDYAVPAFILLILLEMVWARRNAPEKYEPKDTLSSLSFGLGNSVVGLFAGGAIFASMLWVYQFRLVTIPWTWWAWIACFVLDDLAYYWFHRTAHRVRWFWASHVNHHSAASIIICRPHCARHGPAGWPCPSSSACRLCWLVSTR